MSAVQHHEIAGALRARQRILEQVDGLLVRLTDGVLPALTGPDVERVNRIRDELATLHHTAACASQSNRESLHTLRTVHEG